MARVSAVLLIPVLLLCQTQVEGLDYGCQCGMAKKGNLNGFRKQAATSDDYRIVMVMSQIIDLGWH